MSSIILCIQWKAGSMGCCFFSEDTLELQLMEDIMESDHFQCISMLLAQLSPTLVIIPEVSNDKLYHYLNNEYGTSINIKKMAQKEFAFEKGRYMLLNWYIKQIQSNDEVDTSKVYFRDPEEGNKTHGYLHLEGLLELNDSKLTLGCAGVILKHLETEAQERSVVDRNDTHQTQPETLKLFSCDSYMQVNSDTMRSLCIFNSEAHPNMHQKREKESLSLFGLLDKTSSVLGKLLLKEWVSHPIRDKKIIDNRHTAIKLFLQMSMKEKVVELRSYLRHIKNIHHLLAKLREGKAKHSDWQYLLKFAYYTIQIFGSLKPLIRDYLTVDLVHKIKEALHNVELIQELGSAIDNTIDFEMSKAEGRVVVKEGVDSQLDELREKYEKLEDFLLEVSLEIGLPLPAGLRTALNVVYFPQLGYLVTLPQYHMQRNSERGSTVSGSTAVTDYRQLLEGFELQLTMTIKFTTENNLYYKNDRTRELDLTVGDLHSMMADREIEILQELAEVILQYSLVLIKLADILSELDCILSLTLSALKFNYVQPTMSETDNLVIKGGRHPFQELCVQVFIPNDIYLKGGQGFLQQHGSNQYSSSLRTYARPPSQQQRANISTSCTGSNEFNSIQIVTGANFSGKSVFLKQVALIVYMAHIGSFVPADSAIIGITDKLFTRIQTSETVSKPQSAFGYDLQQINRALINATRHSLVIIDEFGKGTDSSDGAAMFCSVVGYFLSKRDECPKVLASTHFHDIISRKFLSAQDGINLTQTEILNNPILPQQSSKSSQITTASGSSGQEVVFLYRIVPGDGTSKSHGLWCASIAGLPKHTLNRAIRLTKNYMNNEPIQKISSNQEQEKYKCIDKVYEAFLQTDINEINPLDIIQSIEDIVD